MIIYAGIMFAFGVMGCGLERDIVHSQGNRILSMLLIHIPIYGRLFGWW